MISLCGVKKFYGKRCVLELPDLSFREGERCALLGVNGSGKSTLLRILGGLISAEAGTVSVPGGLMQDFGYMPQRPYPFSFSVLKNISIADPGGDEAAARRALEAVGLASLEKSRGDELSGGEAQRMAFARMLVRERCLLLLDEPTSAMDIAGSGLVESTLLDYCGRTGCTLIFSTHSIAQAQRLAQRVLLLDGGRVVEDGTADEVLHDPKSQSGKDFLRFWRH